MSQATWDTLCCLPVLLLWLGPLALVAYCGLLGGCSKLTARLRRSRGWR